MKQIAFLLGIFLLGIRVLPAIAEPDADTKLGRGLSNVAFGWFEVVNEMGNQSDIHGPVIGVPGGFLRGAVFAARRMLVGVYEIVSFPSPNGEKGYGPIVLPESVFARR